MIVSALFTTQMQQMLNSASVFLGLPLCVFFFFFFFHVCLGAFSCLVTVLYSSILRIAEKILPDTGVIKIVILVIFNYRFTKDNQE